MAGLDPVIHVFLARSGKDVDARHKAGMTMRRHSRLLINGP
jgi:hypothetical protein